MTRLITLICISAIALVASAVLAQTDTTFTYQGVLQESGEPTSGCAGPAILAPHPIARNAFPFKLL